MILKKLAKVSFNFDGWIILGIVKTVNELFSKLTDIFKELFRCKKVTFTLVDNEVITLCSKENIKKTNSIKEGKNMPSKLGMHGVDIEVLSKKLDENFYEFNNTKDKLCHFVYKPEEYKERKVPLSKRIYCIIQWDKSTSMKLSAEHSQIYQMILKMFALNTTTAVKNLLLESKHGMSLQRSVNVLDACTEIIRNKNLAYVYDSIINLLPNIFHVKKVGVFFCDPSNTETASEQKIFSIASVGEDENGFKFVRNMVKFSIGEGYTAYSILKKKMLIYNQEDKEQTEKQKRNNIKFDVEVDNFQMVFDMTTALYNPIIDADGKIQGVLQLINLEKDSYMYDDHYLQEFESVWKIIATAVKNCQDCNNIISLRYEVVINYPYFTIFSDRYLAIR